MRPAYRPGVKHRHPPTARGIAAMCAAQAALYGEHSPLSEAENSALREQLRRDDSHARQGELHLAERGRG